MNKSEVQEEELTETSRTVQRKRVVQRAMLAAKARATTSQDDDMWQVVADQSKTYSNTGTTVQHFLRL